MIRLRFVQEYRGRRIVTNGTLYGVEGELITDCRYLSVDDTRAAIDSELNAAAHRAHVESARKHLSQFVAPHDAMHGFGCDCGWRGPYGALVTEGRDVVVVRCPKCASADVYLVFDEGAAAV